MSTTHGSAELTRIARGFPVRPRELLLHLLTEMDVGRDGRITADDLRQARRRAFTLPLAPGLELRLSGAERISHFASLLGAEIRKGNGDHAILPITALAPSRLDAMLALVSHSWDRLVRRANLVDDMAHACDEGILAGRTRFLYVPETDPEAVRRLRRKAGARRRIRVIELPRHRGARWHRRLEHEPGIAYLPRPYLVPGGMFTEMYGWDSYFQARGALVDGRVQIARDVAENLAYQIEHYGRIANTNRSYHLSRTQPPLLTPLAREVFGELERRGDPDALPFLGRMAHAAEAALATVWSAPPRITPIGLSRYHDDASGPCPEVDALDPDFYARHPRTQAYWDHDRAQRESGWDLTHRFGDEAHQHVPVCLNSLLYRYERDLAAMIRRLEGARSRRAARFDRRAQLRRQLIDRYLWDPARGLYFDWSLARGQRTTYESAATFYPLWVGAASGEQAARVAEATERFIEAGGLATSTRASRSGAPEERFQWDWPIGWAPLQVIAVEGLRRYGFHHLADRIAYRWIWMVMQIAGDGNGLIKEKYDVVARTAEVDLAEYENQGIDRGPHLSVEPPASLGFGWTNASIPLLLGGLEEPLQARLDAAVAPGNAGC